MREGWQRIPHSRSCGVLAWLTARSNREGRITQHTEYIAFGEVLFEEHSTSKTMPYLFNGKELDTETGLYYYGARYYDPRVSLWLNVDPLVKEERFYLIPEEDDDTPLINGGGVFNPMNQGVYSYTYNNPIMLNDPDGKCPICIGALVSAATDYGLQVASNYLSGKRGLDAWTDVDTKSIVVSAITGAAGAGIVNKIKKFDKIVNVATRTTRSGDKAAKITYKSGKIKDISKTRVKEYVPAPKNPNGKPNQINFKKNPEKVPKGSEVFKTDPKKRTPTTKELKQLEKIK